MKGLAGVLQADTYAGFNSIYEGGVVKEAACWAHARRPFYDVHVATKSPVAAEAMVRIGAAFTRYREMGRPRSTATGSIRRLTCDT